MQDEKLYDLRKEIDPLVTNYQEQCRVVGDQVIFICF